MGISNSYFYFFSILSYTREMGRSRRTTARRKSVSRPHSRRVRQRGSGLWDWLTRKKKPSYPFPALPTPYQSSALTGLSNIKPNMYQPGLSAPLPGHGSPGYSPNAQISHTQPQQQYTASNSYDNNPYNNNSYDNNANYGGRRGSKRSRRKRRSRSH